MAKKKEFSPSQIMLKPDTKRDTNRALRRGNMPVVFSKLP